MRLRMAALLLALGAVLLWVSLASGEDGLTLEGSTASSLTVSWDWSGQTASAWELAWRARGDDASVAWRAQRKAAADRRHTISGLEAGVHYVIRVRALNARNRPLGDLRSVFTTNQSAPGALRISARSDTSLTLGWSAPADWTPRRYKLRWREVGSETILGERTLPATTLSRQISSLTTGTAYVFRLTALNARGGESPVQTLTATAAAPPRRPPRRAGATSPGTN